MIDLDVDHFLIRYKQIDSQNWTNVSNMDSTFSSRTIGGDLNHENFMFGIFKPIVLKIKVIIQTGQQLIHFILEILLLKNLIH